MMKPELRIAVNRIRTPDGTIIQSMHRHDYVSHKDATNGCVYAVDGGLSYLKRTFDGPYEELSLYEDASHTQLREAVKWGTRGKNNDQPTRFVSIAEMETDHIEACLETQPHMSPVIRKVMSDELAIRKGV